MFQQVASHEKIAKDPENPDLLVVEKHFGSGQEGEIWKMAYENSWFGEPPSRVAVQLMATPPVSKNGVTGDGQGQGGGGGASGSGGGADGSGGGAGGEVGPAPRKRGRPRL